LKKANMSHLVLTDCSLSIGSFRNYLKQYTRPTTTHQEPSLPRVFFFCTLDLKIDMKSCKHHSTNKKSEMTTISTNTHTIKYGNLRSRSPDHGFWFKVVMHPANLSKPL